MDGIAIVKIGPDHSGIVVQRHAATEAVDFRAVAGGEPGLLAPARAVAHKDIGPAERGRDHSSIVVHCNGGAEEVTVRALAGDELGLLTLAPAGALENISRAGIDDVVAIVAPGPDHSGIAVHRDAAAKEVTFRAIAGKQLLRLCGG